MITWLESLPLAFIPLFVAIDPIGLVPLFMGLTKDIGPTRFRKVINQASITAAGVCIGFMLLGKAMFTALGITIADFQVAGGLILLGLAAKDLLGMGSHSADIAPEEDVGVVPLGMPLIAGPAAIATLLSVMDTVGVSQALVALAVNLLLVNLAFRNSNRIAEFIGITGMKAIAKIVGLLLTAIAVNMIRRGLEMG